MMLRLKLVSVLSLSLSLSIIILFFSLYSLPLIPSLLLPSLPPFPQLLLLNAVRDVANAMGNLIDATKVASGKSVTDPAMENLKEVAKVH